MLNRRWRAAQATDSERGSIAMAMLVLMIITLLGAGVLLRSQNGLTSSSSASLTSRAEAGAERGLAEAFARIEADESGSFIGGGDLVDGSFRYEATEVDPLRVDLYAEATVNGVSRAVTATLIGEAAPPFTLFAVDGGDIDQSQQLISGRVGTDGTLDVSGTVPGDTQELFGPGATCANCPDAITFADRLEVPEPAAAAGRTQRCRRNGVLTGVISGRRGRPMVCEGLPEVRFVGSLRVVNGPLMIQIGEGVAVVMDDADINLLGDENDLQILLASGDSSATLSMTGARARGVLYAPGRSLVVDDLELSGSLTIGRLTIPGGGRVVLGGADLLEGGAVEAGDTAWTLIDWQRTGVR